MTIRFSAPLLLLVALSLAPTLRAQETISLDPAHSEVHFTLGDVLHVVHGTFNLQNGEIQFFPATGKAAGSIVVDAASGLIVNSTSDHSMTNDELKVSEY